MHGLKINILSQVHALTVNLKFTILNDSDNSFKTNITYTGLYIVSHAYSLPYMSKFLTKYPIFIIFLPEIKSFIIDPYAYKCSCCKDSVLKHLSLYVYDAEPVNSYRL